MAESDMIAVAEPAMIVRAREHIRVMVDAGHQEHEQGDLEMMLTYGEPLEVSVWLSNIKSQAAEIQARPRVDGKPAS